MFSKSRNRENDMYKLACAFFDNIYREQNCEFGGWGLDDKRPFGNKDVYSDILEIIGIPYKQQIREFSDELREQAEEYVEELYDDLGVYLKEMWKSCKCG